MVKENNCGFSFNFNLYLSRHKQIRIYLFIFLIKWSAYTYYTIIYIMHLITNKKYDLNQYIINIILYSLLNYGNQWFSLSKPLCFSFFMFTLTTLTTSLKQSGCGLIINIIYKTVLLILAIHFHFISYMHIVCFCCCFLMTSHILEKSIGFLR